VEQNITEFGSPLLPSERPFQKVEKNLAPPFQKVEKVEKVDLDLN